MGIFSSVWASLLLSLWNEWGRLRQPVGQSTGKSDFSIRMPRQNHPAIVCPRSISFFDTVRQSRFLLLLYLWDEPWRLLFRHWLAFCFGTLFVSLRKSSRNKRSELQIISRILRANVEHSRSIMRILAHGDRQLSYYSLYISSLPIICTRFRYGHKETSFQSNPRKGSIWYY